VSLTPVGSTVSSPGPGTSITITGVRPSSRTTSTRRPSIAGARAQSWISPIARLEMPVLAPLPVEGRRPGGDADVLDEGGDDALVPAPLGERQCARRIDRHGQRRYHIAHWIAHRTTLFVRT
jgi:hypothetical protein